MNEIGKVNAFRLFVIKRRIRIPYMTVQYDKYKKRIVVGWAVHHLGCGCVLWTDKFSQLVKFIKDSRYRRFIFVEQHTNGHFWFHPRTGYHRTKRGALKSFKRSFWWDLERPYLILEIAQKFPTGYDGDYNSWYTKDCEVFTQDKLEKKFTLYCKQVGSHNVMSC